MANRCVKCGRFTKNNILVVKSNLQTEHACSITHAVELCTSDNDDYIFVGPGTVGE